MSTIKTDAERFEASKHVDYELTQLNDCLFRLALQGLQNSDPLLYNSLLTAFTIYARNIHLFLYAEKPRDNDIVASRYFDDPAFWESTRPQLTPLLDEMVGEIDKRSAHLTYRRTEKPYWWLWVNIHNDLRAALKAFVTHVPPGRVVPEILMFEQRWSWTDTLLPAPKS